MKSPPVSVSPGRTSSIAVGSWGVFICEGCRGGQLLGLGVSECVRACVRVWQSD